MKVPSRAPVRINEVKFIVPPEVRGRMVDFLAKAKARNEAAVDAAIVAALRGSLLPPRRRR